MPPKKKGAGKKPAEVDRQNLGGLIEEVEHLRKELDKERKDKNYFQLERDKIHTTLEVTERELQIFRLELKNLDTEIEEDERWHQAEIELYKQKATYLLHVQQKTISKVKSNFSISTSQRWEEQKHLETELKSTIHSTMKNVKMDYDHIIKELELKHEEEKIQTRNKFEEQRAEIRATNEKRLQLKELEETRKEELSDIKDQWKRHIATLIEDHNNSLKALRECTTDIQPTVDNCESLKTAMDKMNMSLKQKNTVKKNILEDNKCLAERLLKVDKDAVQKELKVNILKSIHSTVYQNFKEKQLNARKTDYKALKQKFRKLQMERNELCKSLSQEIIEMKHIAGLKSVQLETELKATEDRLEMQTCSN
ncbi:hypothetical protein JOB18_025737 [Solea senegalensis]|uniref:Growth arrest-specific protein 8 n=1 Tax=Solea senegalensis TaxID=28829 RepID=A0AAV6RRK0_SOLSE|nr:dynein regulatory complex subunit 4-like [Solea senegalensis]KAG7486252.1 hypothetical protein JOB18_028066 [Solea senegalensis]KAG7507169.1 hypothetical protein JOB18_025737 [Solea senegalensis]